MTPDTKMDKAPQNQGRSGRKPPHMSASQRHILAHLARQDLTDRSVVTIHELSGLGRSTVGNGVVAMHRKGWLKYTVADGERPGKQWHLALRYEDLTGQPHPSDAHRAPKPPAASPGASVSPNQPDDHLAAAVASQLASRPGGLVPGTFTVTITGRFEVTIEHKRCSGSDVHLY